MSILDNAADKLNFKKALKIYAIVAVMIGIISVGIMLYLCRGLISMNMSYEKLSDDAVKNGIDISKVKNSIDTLAKNDKIKDILLVNNSGTVLYSAKKSEISAKGRLLFSEAGYEQSDILVDMGNPKILFKVSNENSFSLFYTIKNHGEVTDDDVRSELTNKKIYSLNYISDKVNENKIIVVSDLNLSPAIKTTAKAIAAIVLIFLMAYWVLVAFWAYSDARKHKMNSPLWGLVVLFTNLMGIVIYLFYKQSHQVCYKCGTLQAKGNIYCTSCGTKLCECCQSCGEALLKHSEFCGKCGKKTEKSKGS